MDMSTTTSTLLRNFQVYPAVLVGELGVACNEKEEIDSMK